MQMDVKSGEQRAVSPERPLDELDASTLALKAETDRLEELQRRAKSGESQKENVPKDKGTVLERLRLMEWKRNEQDRVNILSSRAKHKQAEIHTLPQKAETDLEYFSGTGTGGRRSKMKRKAKKEVTTISLEELGCREIAKNTLPQQRVYHPPPPPPAINAWSQKSGSELFSDVTTHSLTVYGVDDEDKMLKLALEESIRTAREEQDRIINLCQTPIDDKRSSGSTMANGPEVPTVSGESWDEEGQGDGGSSGAAVLPSPAWGDAPVPSGGLVSSPAWGDRLAGNGDGPWVGSDAQGGRDGWNTESSNVKYMGKANFKRDNFPYTRNNNNRQQNRANRHEEDREERDGVEERPRDSGRNFGNRPNSGRQQNRPNRHQEDRVAGVEDEWKVRDNVEEQPRDSGRNFGNRLHNSNNNRPQNRPNRHQEDRLNGGEDEWKERENSEELPRDSGRNFGNRLHNNNARLQNRPNRHQEDRVSGGEDDWKERDNSEEQPRDSGRNFGNRLHNNNGQGGRNRGGRGGGQGRNWNHSGDRSQGFGKENRYNRNNNNDRAMPVETPKQEEENWDEGEPTVTVSQPVATQSNWSDEVSTVKVPDSNSRSVAQESWSNPPAPPLQASARSKIMSNESENWDDGEVSEPIKPVNGSIIAGNAPTTEIWNGTETSTEESYGSSRNNHSEEWDHAPRNKNYGNPRNRRGENWNDSRGSRNEGYYNSRNDRSEDRSSSGSRRGNFYPRNGRSDDWNETNSSHASKRDGHQNGWRHGQGRKYQEDRVQEERHESWDENDSSDRSSQRNNFHQGYQRKRGTGAPGRNRNFSDNWNKDGNQGNWNRRDDNSRSFGKENYSGNRTYYRTRNYSESKSRGDEHASDGSEHSGSSKDLPQENSSYQQQTDVPVQNPISASQAEPAETAYGTQSVKEVPAGLPSIVPTPGTRLSDKVLHYMARIKEECEPEEVKVESHVVDIQDVQPERHFAKASDSEQYQDIRDVQPESHFTKALDGGHYENVNGDHDTGTGTENLYDNSGGRTEEESVLDIEQQPVQELVYYEESCVEQEQATLGNEVLVETQQQTMDSVKEWQEEPVMDTREYDYPPPQGYTENPQLDVCNGRNEEHLAKEVEEANQPVTMTPPVSEHMIPPQRFLPSNFYALVPPPSQMNPATLMMTLPSGLNVPLPPGAPYGFSIPPPNMMMAQNVYQNNAPHYTQDKQSLGQEHIEQQSSSLKQPQVMTSSANSTMGDNNLHGHANVSSHLPPSAMYHPNLGQMYGTYTNLPPQNGGVPMFVANSTVTAQKPNVAQTHHTTTPAMVHNPPTSYSSNLAYQHGTGSGPQPMIDPNVQRLNSFKEGILKQVLSGNMTDPAQLASVLSQLQPGVSPMFMTANPQYYPSYTSSSSSMMTNGYCSGMLAVDTNGSTAPSVNGSPSPHAAPVPVYSTTSVPHTGTVTCAQVTQSHDGSFHPHTQIAASRPVMVSPYVYQQMYSQPMYQNGGAPEQLALLQQQMASLTVSQPPPGFNV